MLILKAKIENRQHGNDCSTPGQLADTLHHGHATTHCQCSVLGKKQPVAARVARGRLLGLSVFLNN